MKRSRPEEDVAKAASAQRAAATTSGSSGATAKRAKKGTAFGDQLARMVDNPLCADVELLVGQEGTPIYASKVILVARSPVFEALLGGNFREGQPPPPPSSSSSSSSSSSVATSSAAEASSSSALAPVFWHRAEIGDMEPRTMRHLLHCLYTDQLHPDLVAPPSPSSPAQAKTPTTTTNDDDEEKGNDEDSPMTQQERDLVALFVAADRYLVDKAQTLVRRELMRRFSNGDYANVLPVFDLALALAPELATRACQPVIEARATQILVDGYDAMEARWLGLSDTAAARVVGMDLEGIGEIYVFRAIQRRYEHHLAEAMGPDDDDDDDGDNEGKDNSDEKKRKEEEMKKKKKKKMKREAAIAAAKKKVAGLIKGIKTSLLGVNALSMVVEPSGLHRRPTDSGLQACGPHPPLRHQGPVGQPRPQLPRHAGTREDLGDQLARMVDNPLCADVQLLVGQEGTPVYASKVILMACSPVFEALLGSNFREGQPPPWSGTSSSWSGTWSSSLAPVFWHRAEIGDMEPRTMRHLLHCLYTDQLSPDFATSSSAQASSPTQTTDAHPTAPTERERDLVALYVAADRYLVDAVRSLAERELMRSFEAAADQANVLPVFNLALVVAPTLAMSACQPFIEARAKRFLGGDDAEMEARWLGLSDTAAALVVGMDLEDIDEISVFRAIQRRYQHHLLEAYKESNFNHHDHQVDGELKKRRQSAAIAEAKKRVGRLLRCIKTRLMNFDKLSGVVEPSGLLTEAHLCAAYKQLARTRSFIIPQISAEFGHHFPDRVPHKNVVWSLEVQRTGAGTSNSYVVNINVVMADSRSNGRTRQEVSANGITVTVYYNRRRIQRRGFKAKTRISVPGKLAIPFSIDRPSSTADKVTIIVHIPTTAFAPVPALP